MQWNSSYNESVHSFANTINTHEGGTHEEGFRASLTSVVNKYATREEAAQGEGRQRSPATTSGRGWPRSSRSGCASRSSRARPRAKLGNTEAKSFVQKACNEWIADWFERNPTEARTIISKAVLVGAGAGGRAQGARSGAPQGRAARSAGCPASWPTAAPPTRRGPSSTSWRATRPAARPSPAATRCSRRSCRSAARSSTWRRRASTGCCKQHRGAVADHRARHRHPRRVRPGQAALSQDRADGRRRRRRPAHPHPAADAAVPVHAPVDRGRPRLPGAAAAVQDQVDGKGAHGVRVLRPRSGTG